MTNPLIGNLIGKVLEARPPVEDPGRWISSQLDLGPTSDRVFPPYKVDNFQERFQIAKVFVVNQAIGPCDAKEPGLVYFVAGDDDYRYLGDYEKPIGRVKWQRIELPNF